MPPKCYVQDCASSAVRKFKFPDPFEDKERFLKWLAASGNLGLLKLVPQQFRNSTICARHFESKYFMTRKLNPAAVPSLHLPGTLFTVFMPFMRCWIFGIMITDHLNKKKNKKMYCYHTNIIVKLSIFFRKNRCLCVHNCGEQG